MKIACVGLLVALATGVAAQTPSAQDVLTRARAQYERGNYDSVVVQVKAFLNTGGKDPATEQLVPILSEALLRTGEHDYVSRLYAIFEKKFPQSPFMARMHYLNALALARGGKASEAVDCYSRALKEGVNPDLDSGAIGGVLLVCERILDAPDISSLLRREDLHPRVREALAYGLVVKHSSRGQSSRVQRAARDLAAEFPHSRYLPQVERMASQFVREQGSGQVNLGLLAPLSGYDSDIGKRVLQGAQLAVDEHNAVSKPAVRLVIADTRSSPVVTARKTYELITDSDASVLIGPVLSQEAAVSAAMLVERDQVMISPTATDDGIASLGSNVFQMNVTMGVLGRAIAEYAVKNLSITEYALLTPLSEYGRVLSESFKAEVTRLGGVVVAEQFYDEGANDYRAQFLALRKTMFQLRRARDSTMAPGAPRVTGARTRMHDSLCLADTLLPVGGLFMPAQAEDVVMIAPQVAFHRIQTQILGASGWHAPKVISDGKKYVENAVFVTTAESERTDSLWNAFRTRYVARFAADPDRVSALGYDAARLACTVLSECGGFSSAKFVDGMRRVQGYRGVSGTVSIDPVHNVNREAVVMKILDRKFIRVK